MTFNRQHYMATAKILSQLRSDSEHHAKTADGRQEAFDLALDLMEKELVTLFRQNPKFDVLKFADAAKSDALPIRVTRYCPFCKHTTKHSYDGETFTCLAKKCGLKTGGRS